MRCPRCEVVDLLMTDRSGIEIDYCPTCRGVWLDRGELDKLIERAAPPMAAGAVRVPTPPLVSGYRKDDDDDRYRRDDDRYRRDDDDDRYKRDDDYTKKKRKRGGILGEIFDFD